MPTYGTSLRVHLQQRRSRWYAGRWSQRRQVAVILLADALLLGVALLARARLVDAATVLALILAVQVAVVSLTRDAATRAIFVAAHRDDFNEQMFKGCARAFLGCGVALEWMPSPASDSVTVGERQLSMLRDIPSDVGAVLLAAVDDRWPEIFDEVERLRRDGVEIAVLGGGLPDGLFLTARRPVPIRAYTPEDNIAEVLVAAMSRRVKMGNYHSAVFIAGPVFPSLRPSRANAAVYRFARDVHGIPVRIIERVDFESVDWLDALKRADWLGPARRALIYANSDGDTLARLMAFLKDQGKADHADVIGCGGARNGDGSYIAHTLGAIATVDLQPEHRGYVAAKALLTRRHQPANTPVTNKVSAGLAEASQSQPTGR